MITIITGIPGSGKTTVIKKTIEKIKDIKVVNYGDIMLEIARKKGLVKDRDELRMLETKKQKKIQISAARHISNLSGDILLDTHCTIKTPKGYLPGIPEWVLKELKPDCLILIESNPDSIAQRRERDKTRERDVEDLDEIKMHQEVNRYIGMGYSILTGMTVKIINNSEGRLNDAVKEMIDIIKQPT